MLVWLLFLTLIRASAVEVKFPDELHPCELYLDVVSDAHRAPVRGDAHVVATFYELAEAAGLASELLAWVTLSHPIFIQSANVATHGPDPVTLFLATSAYTIPPSGSSSLFTSNPLNRYFMDSLDVSSRQFNAYAQRWTRQRAADELGVTGRADTKALVNLLLKNLSSVFSLDRLKDYYVIDKIGTEALVSVPLPNAINSVHRHHLGQVFRAAGREPVTTIARAFLVSQLPRIIDTQQLYARTLAARFTHPDRPADDEDFEQLRNLLARRITLFRQAILRSANVGSPVPSRQTSDARGGEARAGVRPPPRAFDAVEFTRSRERAGRRNLAEATPEWVQDFDHDLHQALMGASEIQLRSNVLQPEDPDWDEWASTLRRDPDQLIEFGRALSARRARVYEILRLLEPTLKQLSELRDWGRDQAEALDYLAEAITRRQTMSPVHTRTFESTRAFVPKVVDTLEMIYGAVDVRAAGEQALIEILNSLDIQVVAYLRAQLANPTADGPTALIETLDALAAGWEAP